MGQNFWTDSIIRIYIHPEIYIIKELPRPLFPKLGIYIGILRWKSRVELSRDILSVKAMSMGTLILIPFSITVSLG